MRPRLVLSFLLVLVSGCSLKKPMPESLYSRQANLLVQMGRCNQAGYLSSYDYRLGFQAMSYIVNTWKFDEGKFKKEFDDISLRWNGFKAQKDWCQNTKKNVDYLIRDANQHRVSSQQMELANQQAIANIAQSLQRLGQVSQQAGQQALNSVQNTPSVQPVIPIQNNNKTNLLPPPDGYERTVVPSGSVGVLRNSSFSRGAKLCEYSNGRAITIPASEACPGVLK